MQTQRTELLNLLPQYGWRVAEIEENPAWWADEMWLLQSVWSPVGCSAYITFLVDPQFEGNRKKGEAVWAIIASIKKPVSHLQGETELLLRLGHGWQDNLPGFLAFLGILRRPYA